MKPTIHNISQSKPVGAGILAIIFLFIITSCAPHTSNLGKIAPKNQVLPLVADETTPERIWQAKDMEVTYKTVKTGNTYTVEGSLSVNDSVTGTFPLMKWLKLYIHYLDENNTVISTNQINVNTGYRNKLPEDLKLINVPEAPPAAVAFSFSYWGLMSSPSQEDGSPGDWEIYFDPFEIDADKQNSAGNGLFYAD